MGRALNNDWSNSFVIFNHHQFKGERIVSVHLLPWKNRWIVKKNFLFWFPNKNMTAVHKSDYCYWKVIFFEVTKISETKKKLINCLLLARMLVKGIGCLNHQNLGGMDLTTRQRPVPCDGKNGRMAKSIFSIRSLMDVAEDSDGVEFRSRRFDGKEEKKLAVDSWRLKFFRVKAVITSDKVLVNDTLSNFKKWFSLLMYLCGFYKTISQTGMNMILFNLFFVWYKKEGETHCGR